LTLGGFTRGWKMCHTAFTDFLFFCQYISLYMYIFIVNWHTSCTMWIITR